MKSSCVLHPTNERLIIIRKWQVEFCDGNQCAAALLSYFEYWHNWKLNTDCYNKKSNDISEMHCDPRSLSEDIYQYHSQQEMADGILNLYGKKAISEALKLLEAKDVISVHSNPNPRYSFDQTKHFRFYPEICNEWLRSYESSTCQNVASSKQKGNLDNAKMRNRESEKALPSCENASAITKINYKDLNKSINAEIETLDFNFEKQETKSEEEEGDAAQSIILTLSNLGFPSGRLQYPDIIPTIKNLF